MPALRFFFNYFFVYKSGICRPTDECKSVISPSRGTCRKVSYVCCFLEPPEGIDNELVANVLTMVEVSYYMEDEKKMEKL